MPRFARGVDCVSRAGIKTVRNPWKSGGTQIVAAVSALLIGCGAAYGADAPVDFAKQILPIFESRCFKCHGPEKHKGKLRLDLPECIQKGGEKGAEIVAGKPGESNLFKLISLPAGSDDIMPASGDPLTKEQIALIGAWITEGASLGDWKGSVTAAPVADAGKPAPTSTPAPDPKTAPAPDAKPGAPAAAAPAPEAKPAVAAADSGVKTAAETSAPPAPSPLDVLAKTVKPAPADALAALTGLGASAMPLAKDYPLVRVDFKLMGAKAGDEQLAALTPLADQVVWLDLAGTKVTDAGLEKLAALHNLTSLHLEKTAVSDAGLIHLKNLEHLEYLNLYSTQVTDAGLTSLEGLKNLKNLYLWLSKVTPEGAERLKKALPGVTVNLGALAKADAPAGAPVPAPSGAKKTELAALFDKDSCCDKAHAVGKECDHPCCKEAAAAGKVCLKCNPGAAAKLDAAKKPEPAPAAAPSPAPTPKTDAPAPATTPAPKTDSPAPATTPAPKDEAPANAAPAKPEPAPKADTPAPPANEANTPVTPAASTDKGVAKSAILFNRDVRPILAENCYTCHGADKNARKAGLRLDVRDSAVAELKGKRPILPGDSERSEVMLRVANKDPVEVMPPPDTGHKLKPEEIDILRKWIDEGAHYQPHWSYIPPTRPAVPSVSDASWIKNPIDAFVLAKLDEKKLKPSPEADRATLLRRLSFDLNGLPPSPSEVDAFVNDTSPDAYEKQVDRLLASPHYGERMAVDWLDVVRYADTNGYHGDEYRSVYPYRDYVIKAFNENKPFDQFTIEQLAGDLLPNATTEQKIASGYNRMNQLTAEGGAQAKEYLAKYVADRVRTTTTAWLGSTVGCAECHDHKFDPFTTKDFYSFGAFFSDIKEKGVYGAGERWDPFISLPSDTQAAKMKQLDEQLAGLQKTLDTPTDQLAAAQSLWETALRSEIASEKNDWITVAPESIVAANGTTLTPLPDGSILSSGAKPDMEIYTVTVRTGQRNLTGVRLEALRDPSFGNAGLSRSDGNFTLSGFEVSVSTGAAPAQPVVIGSATADYEQRNNPITLAFDGKPDTGWAVDGNIKNEDRQAVFRFAQPIAGGTGTTLTFRLKHESKRAQRVIGRFRLSLTTIDNPSISVRARTPEPVFNALRIDPSLRTPEEKDLAAKYYRGVAPELDATRAQMKTAEAERDQLVKEIPTSLVSESVDPRPIHVLPRGNWMDDSGEIVSPAAPAFLPHTPIEGRRATRLDLARWIMAPENPLTSRVMVNRLWKTFYGTGLSKVLEDLGTRGDWPTHPELLDWLAVEFRESGWDVKHMVRLMVTSETYRQSSAVSKTLREADPYNKWLARQASSRLEAEFVRDSALKISGLLSEKVGGPSVKPYQPDGYYADCNTFTGPLIYDPSKGEDQYRRGLYTFWKRTFLHPSLLAFDAPTREECTAERAVSNTPLQALVLLNDPTYTEAARCFAEHIMKEGGANATDRITWAFRQAVSRKPSEAEVSILTALCAKHMKEYQADKDAAQKLIHTGFAPVPNDMDAPELAAWTSVARAILNMHETLARM